VEIKGYVSFIDLDYCTHYKCTRHYLEICKKMKDMKEIQKKDFGDSKKTGPERRKEFVDLKNKCKEAGVIDFGGCTSKSEDKPRSQEDVELKNHINDTIAAHSTSFQATPNNNFQNRVDHGGKESTNGLEFLDGTQINDEVMSEACDEVNRETNMPNPAVIQKDIEFRKKSLDNIS